MQRTSSLYLHDAERYAGRITGILLHGVLFIFLIRFFVIEPGVTDGISMQPTLRDHTPFVAEKLSFLFSAPRRYDLVQHVSPHDKRTVLVKRVIGLPGETVTIKLNSIFITPPHGAERKLAEPYLAPSTIISVPPGAQRTITLSEHEYFVLGDNRQFSTDSRIYGPVHRRLITGKIFPFVLE